MHSFCLWDGFSNLILQTSRMKTTANATDNETTRLPFPAITLLLET